MGSEREPIAAPAQMESGWWAFSPPESCSESASGHWDPHRKWFLDAGRLLPCRQSRVGQPGHDRKASVTPQAELPQPWV